MIETKWNKLTRAQQDLYVRLLWEDGHTERAIASFLKTTKGTIVRRRQSHLKAVRRKSPIKKHAVQTERFRDLLDIHAMDVQTRRGTTPMCPPRYKMAANEATQCAHELDGARCGFEKAIDSQYCRLHAQ